MAGKAPRVINLKESNGSWTVKFSMSQDLANPVTFQSGVDTGRPDEEGSCIQTFGLLGNGHWRFRETREELIHTIDGRRQNPGWYPVKVTLVVDMAVSDAMILQNEEVGSDWVVLLTPKPGHIFVVERPFQAARNEVQAGLELDSVKLWRHRAEIKAMSFMELKVLNHATCKPWVIEQQPENQKLGPVVSLADPFAGLWNYARSK